MEKKKEVRLSDKPLVTKKKSLSEEFKDFVLRGNVIEIAVGLTVGAGFNALINSFVSNIILPPIGMLLQGSAFEQLFIALDGRSYATLEEASTAGAPVMKYGLFLSELLDFLIIAFTIFLVIKAFTEFRTKAEAKEDQKNSR